MPILICHSEKVHETVSVCINPLILHLIISNYIYYTEIDKIILLFLKLRMLKNDVLLIIKLLLYPNSILNSAETFRRCPKDIQLQIIYVFSLHLSLSLPSLSPPLFLPLSCENIYKGIFN